MICKVCEKDMADVTVETCTGNDWIDYPDGKRMESSDYHFNEPSGRCHDCNIAPGGKHHPGCDVERCPRCGGQMISCGCLKPNIRDDCEALDALRSLLDRGFGSDQIIEALLDLEMEDETE